MTSSVLAKTLVWEKLRKVAEPMTLTIIYEGFKAAIPSALLKKCLNEMVTAGRKCVNQEGLKKRDGKHADGRDAIYWTFEENAWDPHVSNQLRDDHVLAKQELKDVEAENRRLLKAAADLNAEPRSRVSRRGIKYWTCLTL